MRQLKKEIVKLLKGCCQNVFWSKATDESDRYICYTLKTTSSIDGYEILELQVDIWTVKGKDDNEWLDITTSKIKKSLNHLNIAEEEFSAVIYFDRTIFETTNDEKMKRNTMYFDIRYREGSI